MPVFWNIWESMESSCVVVEEVSVDMRKKMPCLELERRAGGEAFIFYWEQKM